MGWGPWEDVHLPACLSLTCLWFSGVGRLLTSLQAEEGVV